MSGDPVEQVLELYPRIFFACHTRHVQDPKTRRVLSAHLASILDHMDTKEPISLFGLARHMGVTPSTMSLQIDRLVRDGYVVRRRDKGDARRVELRLSVAGDRIRRAQSVLDPARVREMLTQLSPEESALGITGLQLLADGAAKYMEATPPKLLGLSRSSRRRSGHVGGQ